jgi:hypothetical protein
VTIAILVHGARLRIVIEAVAVPIAPKVVGLGMRVLEVVDAIAVPILSGIIAPVMIPVVVKSRIPRMGIRVIGDPVPIRIRVGSLRIVIDPVGIVVRP